ncbi:MAG: glycosyltransferase [Candidatus Hydrogenedentes bacterium]|nr:glycosyltransferase [Candidatus Hydrogenedentota bacterium]
MNTDTPKLSLVIPVFNEAPGLQELHQRTTAALEGLAQPWEVIAVDDGSQDASLEMLRSFREQDKRWRVVRLSRNFGQSAALYAGFSYARGEYVLMMDADLQVFPEDIPLLYAKLADGCDMVSGWRVNRRDSLFRKAISLLLNRYTEKVTGFKIHDHGCSLKGFSRRLVDNMLQFSHRCRYLPVDAAMLGGRVEEVEVRHAERRHGASKYSLFKLLRTGFDMVTSITIMPLQLIGLLGGLCAITGFAMGLRVLYIRLLYGNLLQLESVIAAFFFLSGMQLMVTGLMCEYVGRIYIETQRKPLFVIQEELE